MRAAMRLIALLALPSFFSCHQKPDHTGPQATVADAKSALVIVNDLSLWSLTQGVLGAARDTIPIGEKLAILGPAQMATQAGREREFLKVRRESGSEGWVRAELVVSKAILAVIVPDSTVIYSAAANTAATAESIPRMTIVAIHSDTGGMPFIRVTCFNASAKMILRNVYLRNEGVSARPSDVQAAILLQLAAGSKSPKQRKAFLSSAIKDYPDSAFAPDVQSALDALSAPPPEAAPAPEPQASPATAAPAPAPAPPPPEAPASSP